MNEDPRLNRIKALIKIYKKYETGYAIKVRHRYNEENTYYIKPVSLWVTRW